MKQDTISKLLRAKQYIIPNYPLPPNEDKIEILRVVVRESMSFDLLDRLITDICATTQDLIVRPPLSLFVSSPLLFLDGQKQAGHANGSTRHIGG